MMRLCMKNSCAILSVKIVSDFYRTSVFNDWKLCMIFPTLAGNHLKIPVGRVIGTKLGDLSRLC